MWFAQAPANIALIKYMGKKDADSNLPENPSLSYTLDHLLSSVKLEVLPGNKDIWEPLIIPGVESFSLSLNEQKRFIAHLARMKNYFGYQGSFLVQSSNNFPHGSGLASSASSFAALTKCACLALSELTNQSPPSVDEAAQLSRLGSGSSCRSFYAPWALWSGEETKALDLPFKKLIHQVVIVSHEMKKVSSSDAHRRVKTSPHYTKRIQKASYHLELLLKVFENKDWLGIYKLCWDEFQDMHQLFKTCSPPFSYMTEESEKLLAQLQEFWGKTGDGPIVTMDAGPNIHLLYREDQMKLARQFKADYLVGNFDVL